MSKNGSYSQEYSQDHVYGPCILLPGKVVARIAAGEPKLVFSEVSPLLIGGVYSQVSVVPGWSHRARLGILVALSGLVFDWVSDQQQ